MGCTMRGKHMRSNRKIQRAVKSNVESNLKNLFYHPGLTDSGAETCFNSKSCGNLEENVCTEEDLEEMLLKHLDLLYNHAISKLVELGHDKGVALKAVLSSEHCYGELDVLTNIVNNSLSYLKGNGEDQSETDFTDLRDLEEYTLADMVYSLQQAKPNLSKGDAMFCLLMSEFHVGRASTMNIPTSVNRTCCTKEDKDVEGVGSTLDLAGFRAPVLCRFHGGWDFGSGEGGPEFSGNGFSMDDAEYKLQREIECPRRFNLTPSMKSLLKRNVAAFAAGFRDNMMQKQIQSETSSTDPAHVEPCEQPHNLGSEDSVCSVLEKFRELNLDDNLESGGDDDKDGVIVTLLQLIKDLEKKLKERKDWAHKKAMQVAQKVSDVQSELKSLNSEREGIKLLKKGKISIEESTMKRLSDMENALKKASSQIDRAKVIIRTLEHQNAEIRAEREGYKLSASESLKEVLEASKKEKKWLKKLGTWEKQKLKLQDEITAEKEKIKALKMDLDQITQDENEIEAKLRQEQKEKDQALAQMEEEQRSKEAAEANNKRNLETLRLKIEIDFQRHKDDHERLEQELSRLKPSSNTDTNQSNIAKLVEELEEGSYENETNYNRECIICKKDEVSVVFLPCAHQVVCGGCSDRFFNGGSKVTCPCCRALVQQRIRIFGATS